MGHIYALGGPSGVGKTTFLQSYFSTPQLGIRLLQRATGREPRPGERDGFDYAFYSSQGFLQKIFSNDFIHVEQFGSSFYGIEAGPIEEAIKSHSDAVIMSGIYGGTRLREIYGANITVMFMYTGNRRSLMSPDCLSSTSLEVEEIERRLRKKIGEGAMPLPIGESEEEYVEKRMELNALSLAYVNGRLRSGDLIAVLENLRDRLEDTVNQFIYLRQSTSGVTIESYSRRNTCFVLMPFKTELTPIYDDHIVPALDLCGIHAARADRIFSNQSIMTDILDAVRTARIVIADLTHANPNVFYETGICHALGKDVILITQDSEVPFDLRHIRHIRYSYTPRGMAAFEVALKETIKAVLVQ
jgi:guanylate kinase